MYLKSNAMAAAIGSLLCVSVVHSVAAQDAQSPDAKARTLDTVQVTGSHIKRAQLSGVGPVSVVDAEAIERSGATSVETLLQRLPASAGFAGSQSNAYWAENGYGTTQVNLRGLGINRTLVLLNGRRIVNGGTGANSSVDLNVIPVSLIERVEVLKDGASAIYGADAVAGVVNIITKQGFEGAEAVVRYGQTSQGDGEETSVDVSWGVSSERGSLMAAVSYFDSGAVNMASRAPCGLIESDGRLVCSGSSSTIGGRALLADGRRVNFNQVPGGDGDFYEPYSAAKHNYNGNPTLNAVNPIERLSLSVFGDSQLNDSTRAFIEAMYTNRQSRQLATSGGLGVYRPINIAADHPTNPTGQDLLLQRRRLEEAGPRHFFQETDTYRVVAGLKGQFGTSWDWSVAFNWGRNTGVDGSDNVANLDRVDQTLDRSLCSTAPGAAIPCGDYLGYGDLSRDVLDYILYTSRDTGGNEQKSFTANLSGQIFELPAGWVGFAAGVEVRRERGWRDPDPLTVLGIGNTNQQDPIAGRYTAKEAYMELAVPLLQDAVIADSLYLNLAGRVSDYDLFGRDFNYKAGLDWQVSPSLKLRSTYATAFRIPNIPELFGGVSEGNLTTTDPCSGWSGLPASSIVRANCQADGVPAGYVQPGNTILTTSGGNADLEPEDATSFTAGVVWTPTFAPGLTLTLDYYRIRIENAIQRIAGSTKLAICYNTPSLAHPFCDASNFTRDPRTGEVNYLSSQPVNTADEQVSGYDLGALYEFKPWGMDASISADISYLQRYDVRPYAGAEVITYAGRITGGRGSYAKWRGLMSMNASRGQWSGTWTTQYIGRADDINAARGDIGDHAPSVFYHNLQLRYAVSKALDVALGVDNVFDRSAPFIQSYTDANTDTMTYDLLGRRWYARIGYRW
ncbi:TonB-dependent receptor [Stenotrophomonas maltophilia]|jgi:iron complex outermembrane receptor protein|uniref:TonB-dependent receptor n=1 Tax=Stenotrophomonas TaxID=40323 RepID=UPI000DAA3991|nr:MULTISPECIES: TonB-dependent receptor [Stenotrophomonas]MBA0223286.1 TonB-dependent receptor [Stenotrophomonas maltophilia]MBH1592129.1 TonB-dependent receptor [Stenotrophomonas maltophilia]MBH1664278.1 TonB-dependent receptor [Stenotrophomonas maltophilia]MBH1836885.1 TonB-dependent receptor [Stenotrophomonas maltophilia]MDH2024418.1 TonB-dependent receptor [Stenotrophomonas sp. GD03680]